MEFFGMGGMVVGLLLAWWGWSIAEDKGFEPIVGALVGFFMSFLGILILYLWPSKQY